MLRVLNMKGRKFLATVLVVAVVLLGLRLALPWILENYVNDKLADLEGYHGSVEDIDVALWRGAYQIQGVVIQKQEAHKLEPFFTSNNIDLSVQWDRLFDGALVAEVVFWQPQLNLVEATEEDQRQTGEEVDWREHFEELFPFRFNSIRVQDGTIRFRTPGIQSENALTASRVQGEVQNLTNVVEVKEEAFARFDFNGRVLDANLQMAGRVEPTAEQPTFDLNLSLDEVSLPELNPWLREYLNADAHAGTFALYMELAAADGEFEGYAKPFTENVEIFDLDETSKGLLQSAWEAALDFAASIFESQPEEDVATRIPISGSIEEPEAGVWRAIINVLRHAFGGALVRSLEHSISLEDAEADAEEQDQGGEE